MHPETLDKAYASLKYIKLEFREAMDDAQDMHGHLFTRMRRLQKIEQNRQTPT